MLNHLFKVSLKYGAIGGLSVLVYTVALVRTGVIYIEPVGAFLGYIAIAIMPICIFLAINEVRYRHPKKVIDLKNAMLTGLLVSVIAASFYSSLKWVERSLFADVYQEKLIERTRQQMQEEGQTADLIEKRIEAIKAHYGSWQPVINTFVWYIGLGALYSLGSFLILKYLYKQT